MHESVTYAALYLLQRLKARFPAARGSSGHRLFISAFMLSSKVICDDTYSNKSWSIVGQGMFALREINQMEREMCSYLEWQLNVEPNALAEFEARVKKDFKGPGPYPTYNLPSPAPSPMPSTTPYTSAAPQPSFVTGRGPSTSPPKPAPRPPPAVSSVPAAPHPEHAYLSPPTSPSNSMPPTPEASHSASTSPASSASPPTPPGNEDFTAKIATPSGSIPMSMEQPSHAAKYASAHAHTYSHSSSRSQRPRDPIPQAVRRPKCDLFAFAAPVMW